jgi:hypothetical protein
MPRKNGTLVCSSGSSTRIFAMLARLVVCHHEELAGLLVIARQTVMQQSVSG